MAAGGNSFIRRKGHRSGEMGQGCCMWAQVLQDRGDSVGSEVMQTHGGFTLISPPGNGAKERRSWGWRPVPTMGENPAAGPRIPAARPRGGPGAAIAGPWLSPHP